jgi:hypothetical protein
MDAPKTARNVAIIALIAAAIFLLPGSGRATEIFEAALAVAFGIAIAFILLRLYREHRIAIHSLGDRHRALLYGAVASAVILVLARARLWQTGFGELVWFVAAGGVGYALAAVYRHWRAY